MSSLSASIWSTWSWDMLFDVIRWEDEELCFRIVKLGFHLGFTLGILLIVLITVYTHISVINLPNLSIVCWLFCSFRHTNRLIFIMEKPLSLHEQHFPCTLWNQTSNNILHPLIV